SRYVLSFAPAHVVDVAGLGPLASCITDLPLGAAAFGADPRASDLAASGPAVIGLFGADAVQYGVGTNPAVGIAHANGLAPVWADVPRLLRCGGNRERSGGPAFAAPAELRCTALQCHPGAHLPAIVSGGRRCGCS